MSNLREKEIQILSRMMTTDRGIDAAENFTDQWKVLVYDSPCRDIISPLMNVGALRQKGITLHLMIHTAREPIPDAPVIYFVRPTEENIVRIAEDCAKRLYRSFYIHFVSRIDKALLERLARELVASNSVGLVAKIFDEYLDVIALEPYLFTINIPNSFIAYNDPTLDEAAIRGFIGSMTTGLLSTFRVLGSLPVIRASPTGPAQMLAQELCSTLRENISSRGPAHQLFADSLVSDRSRPLLLIFDRAADLVPPLLHTSSYQALIDDLLDYKLNRVTVEIAPKDGGPAKKKVYDLNTSDAFLSRYASGPFPDAVEANERELNEVSSREAELRSRPVSASSAAAVVADASGSSGLGGKDLKEAIESLPEILAKKANLEAHTNILQAVMKLIAAREVPTYFELEQSLISAGRAFDRAAVVALLRDATKGKLADKTRLLAIASVLLITAGNDAGSSSTASIKSQADELDAAFAQGCAAMIPPADQAAVTNAVASVMFMRKLLAIQSGPSSLMAAGASSAAAPGGAYLASFLNQAQSRASSLMAKATSMFSKFTPLYVTRVVDNLAEGRSCPEDDSFGFLDPRMRPGDPMPADARAQKFSEVIVFVIGGGCYAEYGNLQEFLKHRAASGSSLRSILYGASDIIRGDMFLRQLEHLGAGTTTAATTTSMSTNS